MKIAMFGQRGPGDPLGGGIEVVATELAGRMAAMGHKVTCYNRSNSQMKKSERPAEYKGVREKYVPTLQAKGIAAVSSSFFAALACAFGKYDVVHIHAEGPAAMCWLPKMFGKRVVVTVHGLDWQREKWSKGFGAKYIHFGEQCMVKFADRIIVLSRGVQNYFKETYGRDTLFIPNGVNRPIRRPPQLIQKKFQLDSPYILYLSRLVPEKRADLLIKAFKQVKTDKKLVIAGGTSDTDSYFEELQSLARGDDRIVFTGLVRGRLLEELYSNAYLYVLPSDLEGMPLSLLEAMSYGNCCLTSDIAECAEVVEDKAILFRQGDEAALRNRLEELCGDPERAERYRKDAADFICSKYNWDDIARKTIEAYGNGNERAVRSDRRPAHARVHRNCDDACGGKQSV